MDKSKKKVYIMLVFMLFIAIFTLSYYIGVQKIRGNKNVDNNKIQVSNLEKVNLKGNRQEQLKDNAELVFKIRYTKSNDIVHEKTEKVSDVHISNREEIEKVYEKKGYKIKKYTSSKVELIKDVNKYVPNKYVLGIKGEYLAIFRTDKNGDMYIENTTKDITKKNIGDLKAQDINLLTNGDKYFQCNTREEVLSRLEDYE